MKTLGQTNYEMYCHFTDWKSLVTGATLPPWDQLDPQIQKAWEFSANGVKTQIEEEKELESIR